MCCGGGEESTEKGILILLYVVTGFPQVSQLFVVEPGGLMCL